MYIMGTPGSQDLDVNEGTKLFYALGVAQGYSYTLGEKCLGTSPGAKVK